MATATSTPVPAAPSIGRPALTSRLLQHRLLLLAVVGAAFGAVTSLLLTAVAQDAVLFADAAQQLLTGSGTEVFTDSRLQVGPVYLLAIAPLAALAGALGTSGPLLVAMACSAAVGVAVALLVRRLVRRPSPAHELAAGLAVVCSVPLHVISMGGHFEELATVLLLVAAGLLARSGHGRAAAVLVGLAAGCKLWGLLGVPVLLLDGAPLVAAWRTQLLRCRRTGLAVATVGAAYAPFVLLSHVATFEHSWLVAHPSPFALVAAGSEFSFGLRVVQGAFAVTVGALLATTGPARALDRVWIVPAGVCLSRLLLDPFLQDYYLAPVLVCAAVGLWARAARGEDDVSVVVLATAAAPLLLASTFVASGPVGAAWCAALLLGLLGALWRVDAVCAQASKVRRASGASTPQPMSCSVSATGEAS